MSKVKVSVIVPVFNVGEYLSTSLDSILNQTLEDIEIICINDGSTDDSLNILEYYAKKDDEDDYYVSVKRIIKSISKDGVKETIHSYTYDEYENLEISSLLGEYN